MPDRLGRRFRQTLLRPLIASALMLMAAVLLPAPGLAQERPRGAFADLPGVRLWFLDSGGPGVPVVLLHANTGTSANWESQFRAFSQAGFRVIAFDRRGWGQSVAVAASGPQPGTVTEDLDSLATFLHLAPFHVVGVAGGGFVALDYAAWRPERLRSLVVAASTGQVAEPTIRDFSARIAIPNLSTFFQEVSPSYRGSNPEGANRWKEIEEHAHQPGAPAQPLRSPNTFAKLETLATPMLIMPADADLIAPQALIRLWAAHIKTYDWVVVEDAGHSIAWEKPDAFNAAVLAFISKH